MQPLPLANHSSLPPSLSVSLSLSRSPPFFAACLSRPLSFFRSFSPSYLPRSLFPVKVLRPRAIDSRRGWRFYRDSNAISRSRTSPWRIFARRRPSITGDGDTKPRSLADAPFSVNLRRSGGSTRKRM